MLISRVFGYGDFLSTGATNDAVITPAGYAFAIWGLITLLCYATCAAVLRLGLGAVWESRLLAEASVVFVGFSAWLVIAAHNWLWTTVVVFVVMVMALTDIVRLLVVRRADLTAPIWLCRLATLTFGLYLGWSSIAVFINVAAALVKGGWPATESAWQAVVLVVAMLAAVALTIVLRGTPGYVAGALWALIAAAIGAANRDAMALSALAAGAAAPLVITAAAVILGRRASLER
ncbi:MAG: hypothetical protein ACOYBX_10330 [Mycobacterium sp.]